MPLPLFVLVIRVIATGSVFPPMAVFRLQVESFSCFQPSCCNMENNYNGGVVLKRDEDGRNA